jgi:diaminopimelate decarboxylase
MTKVQSQPVVVEDRLRVGHAVGAHGHLTIADCDVVDLASQYGTPLYVYDEALLRRQIQSFHHALRQAAMPYCLIYATKAFCTVAMCHLALAEGCHLDVVSGGELMTALAALAPPEAIHFHGNNKTEAELELALEHRIGAIIVDNMDEIERLNRLAKARGQVVRILLRVAPGVEAHTHEYISTGQQDSKFGFDWESGQADAAVAAVAACDALELRGVHGHIGSQIFDASGFHIAVARLARVYAHAFRLGLPVDTLNLGGGFGVRYTDEDTPLPLETLIDGVTTAVRREFALHDLPLPTLEMEPGRSIVADAGTTLYRVGARKRVNGVRNFVAIDGGMTDNPRFALYGAKYEVMLANRANELGTEQWSVAGKCCESGDMIAKDVWLPEPQVGDILAVFTTGAYNYSMASHYNRIPKPAVVFVQGGQSRLVVARETWQDLLRMDC